MLKINIKNWSFTQQQCFTSKYPREFDKGRVWRYLDVTVEVVDVSLFHIRPVSRHLAACGALLVAKEKACNDMISPFLICF